MKIYVLISMENHFIMISPCFLENLGVNLIHPPSYAQASLRALVMPCASFLREAAVVPPDKRSARDILAAESYA